MPHRMLFIRIRYDPMGGGPVPLRRPGRERITIRSMAAGGARALAMGGYCVAGGAAPA